MTLSQTITSITAALQAIPAAVAAAKAALQDLETFLSAQVP